MEFCDYNPLASYCLRNEFDSDSIGKVKIRLNRKLMRYNFTDLYYSNVKLVRDLAQATILKRHCREELCYFVKFHNILHHSRIDEVGENTIEFDFEYEDMTIADTYYSFKQNIHPFLESPLLRKKERYLFRLFYILKEEENFIRNTSLSL